MFIPMTKYLNSRKKMAKILTSYGLPEDIAKDLLTTKPEKECEHIHREAINPYTWKCVNCDFIGNYSLEEIKIPEELLKGFRNEFKGLSIKDKECGESFITWIIKMTQTVNSLIITHTPSPLEEIEEVKEITGLLKPITKFETEKKLNQLIRNQNKIISYLKKR